MAKLSNGTPTDGKCRVRGRGRAKGACQGCGRERTRRGGAMHLEDVCPQAGYQLPLAGQLPGQRSVIFGISMVFGRRDAPEVHVLARLALQFGQSDGCEGTGGTKQVPPSVSPSPSPSLGVELGLQASGVLRIAQDLEAALFRPLQQVWHHLERRGRRREREEEGEEGGGRGKRRERKEEEGGGGRGRRRRRERKEEEGEEGGGRGRRRERKEEGEEGGGGGRGRRRRERKEEEEGA